MNLLDLKLPTTPLTEAVRDVQKYLTNLKDQNSVNVFRRVLPGLYIPMDAPKPQNVPECRIWVDSKSYQNISEQFFPVKQTAMISLYLYFYQFAKDNDGIPIDISIEREELVDYVIKKMAQPESGGTDNYGLMPRKFWGFVNPQSVEVDHSNAFKRISELIPVTPPNYVTRIDLDIWTHNKII